MTAEPRTPEEIERDIERDRARLTDRLNTLQDQISIDGALRQVGEQFREHGSAIGQSLSRTVKDNPAAVALTGIGLAWLIFGGNSSSDEADRPSYGVAATPRTVPTAPRGPVPRPARQTALDHDLPYWAIDDDDDETGGLSDRVADARDRVSDKAGDVSRAASDAANDAKTAARGAANDAKATARGIASDARASARDARATATARAERLRARLTEGTEKLSEEARARVVAAREKAVEARQSASRRMQSMSAQLDERGRQAGAFYDRQPLVAGALALALGAAIGSALPRTQREDEAMGAQSDQLIDEAERIFHEELDKAKDVAGAAADEAKTIAREKKRDMDDAAPGEKSAVEAAGAEAKKASKRVADTAAKKARDTKLGKVSS